MDLMTNLPDVLTTDDATREQRPRRSLSIVIPAHNEGKIIEETITSLRAYFEARNVDYELIIIDDGGCNLPQEVEASAADKTPKVRFVRYGCHLGKGAAVRQGVSAASKEYVAVVDADLEVPIEEIDKLLIPIERGYDIAIGSRMIHGAQVINEPYYRYLMRIILKLIIRSLFFKDIFDTQCGFKCYRREVAQDLFRTQRINGFAYEVEVLALARKRGYRIREVPVRCIHRRTSMIRPLRDSWNVLRDVLIIWYRWRTGRLC